MLPLTADFNLGCFSPAYGNARHRFLDAYRQVPDSLRREHVPFLHPLAGPDGEPLACDVAWLGQRPDPQSLLILVSGTHGVEGFAGAAIQNDCLQLLVPALLAEQTLGVMLVHALNPWGFAWLRRDDHDGIDLNRNFVDFDRPLPLNQDYERLHPRLTEPAVIDSDDLSSLWSDTGLAEFSDAVTRGQYRHADGCFYGGQSPSWSRQTIEAMATQFPVDSAQRIAVIDLHTGLGPYGHGELINDHPPGAPGDRYVRQWYGDNACSAQLGESVSSIKHGLLDFFWHRLIGERGCFVTLEFGTFPPAQLLSVLLREQAYHSSILSGGGERDLAHPRVTALRNFFYPEETSWKQQVLFRGRQVISMALQGLMHD